MKISKYRAFQIVGLVVLLSGIAVMTPYAVMWQKNKKAVETAKASAATTIVPEKAPLPTPKPTLVTGKPVRLQIPSLGFDLTVADGSYNASTGKWTLSKDKAHYALPSSQPNNEEGNTLIYGHYRKEVFARLHLIKPGAQVLITTDNGYQFTYTFERTEVLDPTNTSIFSYQGAPRLTIQTCSGAYFQNRQMFYFSYTGVQKL